MYYRTVYESDVFLFDGLFLLIVVSFKLEVFVNLWN